MKDVNEFVAKLESELYVKCKVKKFCDAIYLIRFCGGSNMLKLSFNQIYYDARFGDVVIHSDIHNLNGRVQKKEWFETVAKEYVILWHLEKVICKYTPRGDCRISFETYNEFVGEINRQTAYYLHDLKTYGGVDDGY